MDEHQIRRLKQLVVQPSYDEVVGAFEDAAIVLADKIIIDHELDETMLVVGMGADFEEFAAPVCASLEHHRFKISVNCFWPDQTFNPNLSGLGTPIIDEQDGAAGEMLVHLRASFIEDRNSHFDHCVIVSSIVADVEPLASIVRRTREVSTFRQVEVRCALATEHALAALDGIVDVDPLVTVPDIDSTYWDFERLLDRRPLKLIPRQSQWLLGRQFPELRPSRDYGLRR
ncbi:MULTISPECIES: hypothetical protein [unclassified Rhizobium]|uniref:hypothetical protein n=1 Tax=unclassified Rhizobium TaxID=2613769 RepID=UPI001ADB30CA|nr:MULTISPECIES: hypothetical protein [unclassified Rhizobium]MBO9127768.1 hypothetical protein [Rhizobium sp. 16-488-2b]MBO9178230.1 hypothetical protein [Rhizobium sp. 16-488-2a]